MDLVHPQARFDSIWSPGACCPRGSDVWLPATDLRHSRGPRNARGPLLPRGSSTDSTGLSWRRVARRSLGPEHLPCRHSPALRGRLTTLGCTTRTCSFSLEARRLFPVAGKPTRCRASSAVAGTDPRRSVAAFNPRKRIRPLGCRPTAKASVVRCCHHTPPCSKADNVVAGPGQVLHALFSRRQRSFFRTPAVAFQPCTAFQRDGR